MEKYEKYLNRCLKLALKGKGKTNPNPLVGCVIEKNGEIVGEGYHKKAGKLHAERIALQQAGEKASEAVLYTNLEPCAHYGKTPPCTKKIIQSGISKVVCSMIDPNPVNNGKGIRKLREKGIEVIEGVLKEKAEEINAVYIKYITEKMPYVTIKVAQSLDGKIATFTGNSKWISGENSRKKVQELRNTVDTVGVGINTVLADNPRLIPRIKKKELKKVSRVIFDSNLRIPLDCNLVKEAREFPLIIFSTDRISLDKKNSLEKKGVEVIPTESKDTKVNLNKAMKKLIKYDIIHVLIEGGGKIISSFLEYGLVDEIFCFISPKIIGGKNSISSVEGLGKRKIDEAIKLEKKEVEEVGEDILIHGFIKG